VCVVTRDPAIRVLNAVTCAPITRTVRGITSEVLVGDEEGLPSPCVITCDNIVTLPKALLQESPVGALSFAKRRELDRALRFALDIQF
jgi:mRNA interferase MazF